MDFRFTPEEEAFRAEVRAFLQQEVPADWDRAGGEEAFAFQRRFVRKLAERGWLTLAWPKEYGGMGAGIMTQLIYNEELASYGAPNPGIGVDRVGPSIMLYGTEEQKRRFLPPIVRGEVTWCQGFSEPGAGSDLASLQTRAVRDGDSYVINGQKIWTSWAHRADWCILLARTDPSAPKHRGISYFLLDMRLPGVTVRPLYNMAGSHGFNEVFLEDVRVPADCLLGEENRGWYIAAATLDFERSGIHRLVAGARVLERALAAARESGAARRNPALRRRLADLRVELEVGRLLAYRVAWMQDRGMIPNAEASISKLFGTEWQQRLSRVGMEVLGLAGQLRPGSPRAPLGGRLSTYYLEAVSLTIAAGTSEINRNIIAQRGLGLPRA